MNFNDSSLTPVFTYSHLLASTVLFEGLMIIKNFFYVLSTKPLVIYVLFKGFMIIKNLFYVLSTEPLVIHIHNLVMCFYLVLWIFVTAAKYDAGIDLVSKLSMYHL